MKKTYNIMNLDCANCATKIEKEVKNKLNNVISFNINFILQKMTIETDDDIKNVLLDIKKIVSDIEPDCEIYE